MKKHPLRASLAALLAFILWTVAVKTVGVQPIGPRNSSVGFSQVNAFFHSLTGVHFSLYNLTDWLGL
ncbi:MAG: phosphoesterase PA-phosphatase, partial [Oscillospiraceae bacterium]|nr:phosphoesterase PA-phosphatase [Oscillospiraceae bacterium]